MPQRKIKFVVGEYYHVFNRSINKEPIFTNTKDCKRAVKAFGYYRFEKPPIRLSYFLALGVDARDNVMNSLDQKSEAVVDIVSFCLMPNHFHLLLKQNKENGISKFLALFQNSYTRYFNTKYSRNGHLFQGQFKATRMEDTDQLIHVNRYIHLNPYSSHVVKNLSDLEHYPYSSLPEFLGSYQYGFCKKNIVLAVFPTVQAYKNFVFDQADYQRRLDSIKHLTLE